MILINTYNSNNALTYTNNVQKIENKGTNTKIERSLLTDKHTTNKEY